MEIVTPSFDELKKNEKWLEYLEFAVISTVKECDILQDKEQNKAMFEIMLFMNTYTKLVLLLHGMYLEENNLDDDILELEVDKVDFVKCIYDNIKYLSVLSTELVIHLSKTYDFVCKKPL